MKWVVPWIALLCAGSAMALEVPLQFERVSEDQQNVPTFGYGDAEKSLEQPPGDWKLPKFTSEHPVYALIKLGDREQLMVADQKAKKDAFYNKLYFDANANRDLTDDPILEAKEERNSGDGQYVSASFGFQSIDVVVGGQTLPYQWVPNVSCYLNEIGKPVTSHNNWLNFRVSYRVVCDYFGSFELNGKNYKVWLSDTNGNARFNDLCSQADTDDDSIYAMGDRFFLTTGADPDYYDAITLGDTLLLDGTLFGVRIDTVKSMLTLTPSTDPTSTLTLPVAPERMLLATKDAKHAVMLFQPGTAPKLPYGDYRCLTYQLLRNDQESKWRLLARGTKTSPFITLAEGTDAAMPLGEPYSPEVVIPKWELENFSNNQNQRQVRLSLEVRGAGSETVADLSRITTGANDKTKMSARNSNRPQEPTYKVIAPDGEIVTQGSFEYG